MLKLYYWPTPNGHKITIFLHEAGLPYELMPIDIGKGEQFQPEFLAVAPNNRIPALTDSAPKGQSAPIHLFESGAILEYLADTSGFFLPPVGHGQRYDVLKWLYWQVGGLGPMAGQNHHFSVYAPEKIPYAISRYQNETARLYKVLDQALAKHEFVAGSYSIADMAIYPWIVPHERQGQDLATFPHVAAWFKAMASRPAVVKAYAVGAGVQESTELTDAAKRVLFGQSAATLTRS